jgi:L-fucose mutarotase
MLLGIPRLLTPDLLHALSSMGHGDEMVIVDANFPAAGVARRVVYLPGATSTDALDAVLAVMPLDTTVSPAVVTMEVVGDPTARPPAVEDFARAIARRSKDERALGHLERQQFYARARGAYVIVQTGDTRRYANILLVKGTIRDEPAA